jgi:hypothetical protein
MFAGARLDHVPALLELVGERRAVVGAKLAGGAEDRTRGDCDDLAVVADRACDDNVAVQLRVGCVSLEHAARGRVPILGGHEVAGALLADLAAVLAPDGRHRLGQVADRLGDGGGVRGLDLAALGLTGERPHGRDGLRCGEG